MKTAVCLLLFLLPGLAMAEHWIPVMKTDAYTVYVDHDSFQRRGDDPIIKYWRMTDYATPQFLLGKRYQSIKWLEVLSCDRLKNQLVLHSYHSGPRGTGREVYTIADDARPRFIAPGNAWNIFEEVCQGHRIQASGRGLLSLR